MYEYIHKAVYKYPRIKKHPRFKPWKRGNPCICGSVCKFYVERYKWRGFCSDECYLDYRLVVGPPIPSIVRARKHGKIKRVKIKKPETQ